MFRLLAILMTAVSVAGCWRSDDIPAGEIVIGELAAISGKESSFGATAHRGIQMAVDEENDAGPVHGRAIKLIVKDTGSSKERMAAATRELIEEANVFALIGETASDRTLIAAQIAQKERVPLVAYVSTNPSVTAVGDYVFRACYIDPFQGSAMARFAFEDLSLKTIAVIKDRDSNYSMALAEYFTDRFQNLGGEIVYEGSYTQSSTDFTELLTSVKRRDPDAVFIPGLYMQAAAIIQQAAAMKIKSRYLGGDAWESTDLLDRSGKAALGSYYTTHFSHESKSPVAVKFVENYKRIYGTVPDAVAATAYDATKMLIAAMRRAEKLTRNELRKSLAATKDLPGATGPITLDRNRNAIKPVVILKIDEERHSYVKTISP